MNHDDHGLHASTLAAALEIAAWLSRRHIGTRGGVYTILHAISMRSGSVWRGLLKDLQIGDDIVDVLGIGESAIRHAVALHLRLRVLDIGAQIIVIPNEVGPFHRVRVAEVLERPRLAANHALETRPQCVGSLRVTGRTGLEERLAVL